uniref:Uncharacterized protein n=1 Tax=Candidatus Kentrum sp. LFY TaxID=2126342 RepID=A0A450WNY9_9GAMM|nr:MAG: hypothetical protein BECKLFY1418C_GA0070996_104810 [Candidatus Kentron sp. LFY]
MTSHSLPTIEFQFENEPIHTRNLIFEVDVRYIGKTKFPRNRVDKETDSFNEGDYCR